MSQELPILVEVRRGAIVESRHRGAIVAVEPDGSVSAQLGDADLLTSTRSTIKPLQAIPFITSGAADHFGISERELALVCASHEGEAFHVERVAGMLARAGLDESALRCGAHAPYNANAARELETEGRSFTQIHNNCSGKHTGMLLTAVHRGLPLDDYYKAEHPIQREIVSVLTRIAGVEGELPTAIDGCSAPTFGVPLRSLALAFARLVNPLAAFLDQDVANASTRIVRAMIAHPEMVGGTKRFDSDLLRAARGKLVCKIGAESVYGIGVLPSERHPRGLGVAVKIEDGSYRGLGPAVIETLAQLDVLSKSEQAELAAYHHPSLDNRSGVIVGEVRATFRLT
ncbi:MAG TPA: asparaginase [Blastocatellia bacterium]|nr:asparaginase [Blastocatellia bacterium]